MKPLSILTVLISLALFRSGGASASAQGTITFNEPWIGNGIGYFSLGLFGGMSFRVGDQTWPYDNMRHIGATGPSGYPHNGTPYVGFTNTLGTPQYILFAWTDAASLGDHSFTGGTPFGLVSVDLADPVAPSPAPILITFNGYYADDTMVSQTFTVGGGGSTSFQTFMFSSSFGSGLVRVEMPSAAWAMDNLVFIPEPSTFALACLGGLTLFLWRMKRGAC